MATAKGWNADHRRQWRRQTRRRTSDCRSDPSEEALLELLDKAYQYFQDNKTGKERTIRTVERLGMEHLKAAVLRQTPTPSSAGAVSYISVAFL